MLAQLDRRLGEAEADPGVRAVVLTGAGPKAFVAGADIAEYAAGDHAAFVAYQAESRRLFSWLDAFPKPVIGAVNGVAAGAGFSLALMCDTRIASDQAAFVCAYGRIGASPDGGMTYFLPRVVGPSRAIELLLTDPLMSAEQARDERIVSEVVAADELTGRARELAKELAERAPHYVRMSKLLVSQSLDNTLADHLQLERHGIADSMATEDLREGVTAFLEGRQATFSGR